MARAKQQSLPISITVDDIETPDLCPVLGIPIFYDLHKKADNSPSLDRILPAKGYVHGNVAVISERANRLKNNGSSEEHRRIADWIDANVS